MRSALTLALAVLALALLGPGSATAQVAPPTATTGSSQAVAQTTARLTGTADPNGGETVAFFEYGTSTSYGLRTPDIAAGGGDAAVPVQAALSGLTAATRYHYRLVVRNAAGEARGSDRSFRTAAPPVNPRPPGVSTGGVRSLVPTGATLTATVNPNRAATSYRFEYGRTTRYGASTPAASAGAGSRGVAVSAPVTGLAPNTRYQYRVVAANAAGTTRGANRAFTTPRGLTGVTLSVDPARPEWGQALTASGAVQGAASPGTPVALEVQPFPFTAPFGQVGATVRAGSRGTFALGLPGLRVTSRVRVLTRTGTPLSSPVLTVPVEVKVGVRTRRRGTRRTRIEGSVWPAAPAGRASLRKRSRSGRWVTVDRAGLRAASGDRSRYRFSVRRPSPGRRAARYQVRVLARDGGAHVAGTSRTVLVRARR